MEELKKAIIVYTHVVGLGVIRALGQMNVPVVALHYLDCEMGRFSKYLKESIRVPSPITAENKFLSKLVDLSKRFKNSLLIPTDDYTVVTLSKNKELLEQYYVVGVEDWELTRKIICKQNTYEFACSLGIPCPNTIVPKSLEDLKARCQELKYPCLLKPCEGHAFFDHFGAKMVKMEDEKSLLNNYMEIEQLGFEVMIQELIPGDDGQGVNYNSYFVDRKPIAEFTAKKVRIEPPFFGSPRVLVSKEIPDIIESGRLLLKTLNYEGFSCMEFKRDVRDGIFKLMEINCRNNLTTSLSVKCGINFPWIMYRHLMYGEFNKQSSFESGIFWIDISHDLMRFFVSRKEEKYSFREYLKPYFSRKTFAILSILDPLPFVKRLHYLGRLTFKKILALVIF